MFDCQHVLPWREASAVSNAEDMGIHPNCRLPECDIQNHVSGFPTDAGQRLEFDVGLRDGAAVALQQQFAGGDDVLRFGMVKPDALDMALEPLDAELQQRLRRVGSLVQFLSREIDAFVGGLRLQHDGDQQFERRTIFKLATRRGIGGAQAPENSSALGRIHVGNRRQRNGTAFG